MNNKAFLSHNSFDKDFVEPVFNILGSARAVYDKITFKKNCDLTAQIEDGLDNAEIYVLFLSQAALNSNWVKGEIDLAHELKTSWKIKKFLVFQLDNTRWAELPKWLSRYVVSCPPSPRHVALRILDELNDKKNLENDCIGRENDIKKISEAILENDTSPSFLYLSGPIGIGRRTLANAVYKMLYKEIADYKFTVSIRIDPLDDLGSIYLELLGFSANWRTRDLIQATTDFSNLNEQEKVIKVANIIYEISVSFRQVIIFDIGVSALDDEGYPLPWLIQLINILPEADYPYLWFISQRFSSDTSSKNGIFYAVKPLTEDFSKYLFKLLLSKNQISFPSKSEKETIVNSITGHAGLITKVVNYLIYNPTYKPNKTHNNVIKLISSEVEKLLLDFLKNKEHIEKSVAIFGEAYVLSYEEISSISDEWKEFGEAVNSLIDAGFIITNADDYQLAPYLQNYANTLAKKHFDSLGKIRKILLEFYDNLDDETFIPIKLLNARVVEHIISNTKMDGLITNLVMPTQQLKAAKRKYDGQEYKISLRLATEAYEQNNKLSDDGILESWRLIGLSAIRENDTEKLDFFNIQYKKIKPSDKKDDIFNFVNGFRFRHQGNLRQALEWFLKIKSKNSHVYRELAYIYAFEENYSEALSYIKKATDLTPLNSYILDIKAHILLEKYKNNKNMYSEIENCLEELKNADEREETTFYYIRESAKDLIVNGNINSLLTAYNNREKLRIHSKTTLLKLLSIKQKETQFRELHNEINNIIHNTKNKLAEIELARIDIEHNAINGNTEDAKEILEKYRLKFPEGCVTKLEQIINFSTAQKNKN